LEAYRHLYWPLFCYCHRPGWYYWPPAFRRHLSYCRYQVVDSATTSCFTALIRRSIGPPLLLVDLAAIKIVLFKELIIKDQENLIPKNFYDGYCSSGTVF
jgi:hypothetical protein